MTTDKTYFRRIDAENDLKENQFIFTAGDNFTTFKIIFH